MPMTIRRPPSCARSYRRLRCLSVISFVVVLGLGCSKTLEDPPTSDVATTPWHLDLAVTPDHPRTVLASTFTVHIADNAGNPVQDAQLTGSFKMLTMDMGKIELKFAPKGHGDYEATVKSFDMSGPWELTVEAVRGTSRERQVFQVTVFD